MIRIERTEVTLPFTVDQFFEVFGRYNDAVWPFQFARYGVALAALVLLLRGGASSGRAIAAILSFLWAWMAIAYHFAFFTDINPAAWVFGAVFLAGALWLVWIGVVRSRLQFVGQGGLRGWSGSALVLYATILYPFVGYAFGHRYPETPTFGLPCPTTIFTLGLLLFATAPLPRSVFVVPLLWSGIGSVAAFQLSVVQDFGLLVAGLIGVAAVIVPPTADNRTPLLGGDPPSIQRSKPGSAAGPVASTDSK